MKIGKVPENVLIRSVLKNIKTKRKEVSRGAGIGADCAVLSFGEGFETVVSAEPVSAPVDMVCCYALHKAVNNLAAAGAEPAGVLLSLQLPGETEEKELKNMMIQAGGICENFNIQILGGHTNVAPDIKRPVLTVTGIGRRVIGEGGGHGIKPDQDIVVSKWIGLEGTVRLAREHREELLQKYPARMIDEAAGFSRYLSVVPEAAAACSSGVCGMHDASWGGIFAALWELAQSAGVGLTIDLKSLPLKQETVEICEFFDINPYELLSGGSLIMTAGNGETLVYKLRKAGIPAVIVGRTVAGNDRVILNGDEKRFLEPPRPRRTSAEDMFW